MIGKVFSDLFFERGAIKHKVGCGTITGQFVPLLGRKPAEALF